MERLTEKHYKSNDGYYMKCSEFCEKEDVLCEDCNNSQEIIDRLGAIEDILGEEYDLDRLKKVVESYKNGMFVSIPCKVGDTVWVITFKCGSRLSGKEIVECKVNTMRVKSDGLTIGYSCRGEYSNGNNYIGNFVFKSIGKTVFLSREEAEFALKGEQNEIN